MSAEILNACPIDCMVSEAATRYYQVMTRAEWMPTY